jgi:hypothetical protein
LIARVARLIRLSGLKRIGSGLVAVFHLDIGEGGERGNSQIGRHLGRFHRLVDRHPADAGHGVDRFKHIGTGNDEDRPDQVIDGQPGLARQPARPVGDRVRRIRR